MEGESRDRLQGSCLGTQKRQSSTLASDVKVEKKMATLVVKGWMAKQGKSAIIAELSRQW